MNFTVGASHFNRLRQPGCALPEGETFIFLAFLPRDPFPTWLQAYPSALLGRMQGQDLHLFWGCAVLYTRSVLSVLGCSLETSTTALWQSIPPTQSQEICLRSHGTQQTVDETVLHSGNGPRWKAGSLEAGDSWLGPGHS